jgi:hypothetical protein
MSARNNKQYMAYLRSLKTSAKKVPIRGRGRNPVLEDSSDDEDTNSEYSSPSEDSESDEEDSDDEPSESEDDNTDEEDEEPLKMRKRRY